MALKTWNRAWGKVFCGYIREPYHELIRPATRLKSHDAGCREVYLQPSFCESKALGPSPGEGPSFPTGPKPKGIKVENFRIDYLVRTPKVEKLSLQSISFWGWWNLGTGTLGF